ncbi:MAG: DegV family protein [Bacillota bacterium]
MPEIAIVTDSTADLPAETARKLGITIVPLKVIFGQEVYRDGVEMDTATFYKRLRAGEMATTSQPSPGEFEAAYRELLAKAETIISIHISRDLSGTVNAAEAARSLLPDADITVIDSRLVARALGLLVQAAARAAREGKSRDEILGLITKLMQEIRVFFCVDSLEHLRRGGRIGGAQALLGTILNIKPILTLRDGIIQPFEKVRGHRIALRRLAEIVFQEAGPQPVTCLIVEGDNREAADALTNLLSGLPPGSTVEVGRVGTVVGAHAGPGVFGVVICKE